ncbi:MAG: response regulator [Pseudomonadota bacterium]|nr:response regulator [Pseudomonadota bacterium]
MNNKQILLVEDDEIFAQVIGRALVHRDYAVTHAKDSEHARELIAERQYNYAILDLNLGRETSLKLIPLLKESHQNIRILMLTGYASITTAVEAIKLGADNYLAKPSDADEILAALLSENQTKLSAIDDRSKFERMSVKRLEWEHIQKVLQENDGNISATARQLNMHRRTLQRKLQKHPVSK